MITILSIIILFTLIKWIKMWDDSIKQKKDILEFYPKNKLIGLFLALSTIFILILVFILIILYLP